MVLAVSLLRAHAGTVETLDHRRFEGTITLTADGHLQIAAEDGRSQQFPLDSIRVARLRAGQIDSDLLPKGWHAEDIGDVGGSTVEEDNQLTLKVLAKSSAGLRTPAAHYAYRIVRGDGGIMAKLESANNHGAGVSGIMLRENLESSGGFVMLGVTDKKLRLLWRETVGGKIKEEDVGVARFPQWLKLARNQDKDKVVIGWQSQDGMHWQRVGQAKLNARVEPWPAGAPHKKPLLYVGTAITTPGGDKVSSATFSVYTVTAKGLLGEYYADDNFKELKFTRPETKLEMTWDHKSPSPEISPERFSARWTGQVEPRFSEPYRIYLEGNEDTRIWLNGESIPRLSRNAKPSELLGSEVPLQAGEKCDIRIEFKKGQKPSPLKLGWSSRSQKFEWIPAHQLSYSFSSNSPTEESITNNFLPKGIWLRNGTFLAGDVLASDGSSSEIRFGKFRALNVFNQKIAYIVFRTCRRALPLEEVSGKTGLILSNGDFLESEFDGLKDRRLRLTSVLFGQRNFNLDQPEPLALMLNKPAPGDTATDVRLLDGSVLKAKALRKVAENCVVNDSALGQVSIPESEIVEIRNGRAVVASRIALPRSP